MIELLAMGYVGLSGHTVRIARSVAVARMLSTETVKPGGQNLKACSPHWGLNPGPSVYKTDALPLSFRGLKLAKFEKDIRMTYKIMDAVI